jgi:hypothetical protein
MLTQVEKPVTRPPRDRRRTPALAVIRFEVESDAEKNQGGSEQKRPL